MSETTGLKIYCGDGVYKSETERLSDKDLEAVKAEQGKLENAVLFVEFWNERIISERYSPIVSGYSLERYYRKRNNDLYDLFLCLETISDSAYKGIAQPINETFAG